MGGDCAACRRIDRRIPDPTRAEEPVDRGQQEVGVQGAPYNAHQDLQRHRPAPGSYWLRWGRKSKELSSIWKPNRSS